MQAPKNHAVSFSFCVEDPGNSPGALPELPAQMVIDNQTVGSVRWPFWDVWCVVFVFLVGGMVRFRCVSPKGLDISGVLDGFGSLWGCIFWWVLICQQAIEVKLVDGERAGLSMVSKAQDSSRDVFTPAGLLCKLKCHGNVQPRASSSRHVVFVWKRAPAMRIAVPTSWRPAASSPLALVTGPGAPLAGWSAIGPVGPWRFTTGCHDDQPLDAAEGSAVGLSRTEQHNQAVYSM